MSRFVRSTHQANIVFDLDSGQFLRADEISEGKYLWTPIYKPSVEELKKMISWPSMQNDIFRLVSIAIHRAKSP